MGPGPPEDDVKSPVLELQDVVRYPMWVLRAELEVLLRYFPSLLFYLSFQTNYQSLWQASKSVLIIFFLPAS